MKLVVDTNRLIAALVRNSYSRRILFSNSFDLHTLAVTRRDIAKYEEELLRKSALTKPQFEDVLDSLFGQVHIVDDSAVQPFMPQAREAMDSVDSDDAPFLAAALTIKAAGIWTHDPHFDAQALVRVFHTRDLTSLL